MLGRLVEVLYRLVTLRGWLVEVLLGRKVLALLLYRWLIMLLLLCWWLIVLLLLCWWLMVLLLLCWWLMVLLLLWGLALGCN
jgi:hypothetical protein